MADRHETLSARDAALLRRAIALAAGARTLNENRFATVIADATGSTLVESISTVGSTGDRTAHATANAIRLVGPKIDREDLKTTTLFASYEPCPMCAAAVFYSGIRRIVFAFPHGHPIRASRAAGDEDDLGYSCREVLSHAAEPIDVHGPCLIDEAQALFN